MASPRGFEPPAPRLGGACSIQLSYEDINILLYQLLELWTIHMKPGLKFLIIILIFLGIILILPSIITYIFLFTSNYINPIYFILILVGAAAVISFLGGVGRK